MSTPLASLANPNQDTTPTPGGSAAAAPKAAGTPAPSSSASTPVTSPSATHHPTIDFKAEALIHAQRAGDYYENADYIGAKRESELALSLDSRQYDALFILGLLALRNRNYEQAVAFFSNVIELGPNAPAALYQRALARQAVGSPESALEDAVLCQSLTTDPVLASACAKLALVLNESLVTSTPTPAPTATIDPTIDQGYVCEQCIKGNINSEGERIYHFPGCTYYEKTKIDTAKGERWFSSEAEAVAAGWRRAQNCPKT
ncbi:MAG: tetratricopeptide repeat protein [Anaerolineae bacterium]